MPEHAEAIDVDIVGSLLTDDARSAVGWLWDCHVDPALAEMTIAVAVGFERALSGLEERPDPRHQARLHDAIGLWVAAIQIVVSVWRDETREAA